jgi:hypothetical protein
MRPPPPAEDAVKVEPDTVISAVPRVTVVVVVVLSTGAAGLGDGGSSPPPPVEVYVEVDPETIISIEPWTEETLPLAAGKLGVGVAPAVGGMTPLSPVEISVAVEKNVVTSPLPLVVDAGTKVEPGPNSPPPPTTTLVELPEIYVVVAPLIMVVMISVRWVTGRAVGGCCTTVWVMVRVQE